MLLLVADVAGRAGWSKASPARKSKGRRTDATAAVALDRGRAMAPVVCCAVVFAGRRNSLHHPNQGVYTRAGAQITRCSQKNASRTTHAGGAISCLLACVLWLVLGPRRTPGAPQRLHRRPLSGATCNVCWCAVEMSCGALLCCCVCADFG